MQAGDQELWESAGTLEVKLKRNPWTGQMIYADSSTPLGCITMAAPRSAVVAAAGVEQAIVDEVALGAAEMAVAHMDQATVDEVALGAAEMTVAHMDQAVVDEVALGAAEMTVAQMGQAVVNGVALGAAEMAVPHMDRPRAFGPCFCARDSFVL